MARFRSIAAHERIWSTLVDKDTLRTLSLLPGGEADVLYWHIPTDDDGNVTGPPEQRDLPLGFIDAYLEPVADTQPPEEPTPNPSLTPEEESDAQ